ncbi:hypothetical protein [Synechococcus sp. MIT S9503]|uniref:hypothetical protein n=1 Tax=Synechococcus sp. MIT S9503 TaxID=3082547 RepID=UPI0039A55DCF
MTTQEQVIFYLIDDGTNDLFTLLNEGQRYGTGAAALAHRKPGESIWRCTGAVIPDDQELTA